MLDSYNRKRFNRRYYYHDLDHFFHLPVVDGRKEIRAKKCGLNDN